MKYKKQPAQKSTQKKLLMKIGTFLVFSVNFFGYKLQFIDQISLITEYLMHFIGM